MRLRVRKDAIQGHQVGPRMIPPGGVLPGEYEAVPHLMDWKLEPVEEAAPEPPPPPPPPPPPEPEPTPALELEPEPVPDDWQQRLERELGKRHLSKDDLAGYAARVGVDLGEDALREEMIAALDAAAD